MGHWFKEIEQVIAGERSYAVIRSDCLDVGRRLPAGSIDSCIVDPPYGMSYRGKNNRRRPIANDDRPFIWWLYDSHRAIKSPGAMACFCQWKRQEDWRVAIDVAGFDIRSQAIWDRMNGGMGATHCTFAPRHDVIWFGTKGRFRFPHGRPDSVLPFANVPASKRLHSTQKPEDLMVRLIEALTPAGGIVYDPCMGSGSTGAAALACGRRFIGVESDEENFVIAASRLQSVIGNN